MAATRPPIFVQATPSPVLDWLAGKRPEDLDILELEDGRRLYPDALKRRKKGSDELEVVPVRIRPPSSRDKALARLDALSWARDLAAEVRRDVPPDFTISQAEAIFGREYVDELDTKCIVARCTHDWDEPHDQYMLPRMLDEHYDHGSIYDLWDRICFWFERSDVRVDKLDREAMITVLAAIDRVRNVSPLVAIAGGARDSFIVSMASQLHNFLTDKSSSPSTASSTPTVT